MVKYKRAWKRPATMGFGIVRIVQDIGEKVVSIMSQKSRTPCPIIDVDSHVGK